MIPRKYTRWFLTNAYIYLVHVSSWYLVFPVKVPHIFDAAYQNIILALKFGNSSLKIAWQNPVVLATARKIRHGNEGRVPQLKCGHPAALFSHGEQDACRLIHSIQFEVPLEITRTLSQDLVWSLSHTPIMKSLKIGSEKDEAQEKAEH